MSPPGHEVIGPHAVQLERGDVRDRAVGRQEMLGHDGPHTKRLPPHLWLPGWDSSRMTPSRRTQGIEMCSMSGESVKHTLTPDGVPREAVLQAPEQVVGRPRQRPIPRELGIKVA